MSRVCPKLILLDAASGEIINYDARKSLMEDPAGAKYPWKGADTFGKIQPVVANKSIDPKKNKSGNLFNFGHFKKEEILFHRKVIF